MVDIYYEFRRLQDFPNLREIMDSNLTNFPGSYKTCLDLLNGFFARNSSPKDIAIILNGGLVDAHILAYHLEGNGLILYRPLSKHRTRGRETLLRGEIHPERDLLLFDEDMVTGKTIEESANFFAGKGYNRKNIFCYLEYGVKGFGKKPTLSQVDGLIKLASVNA